ELPQPDRPWHRAARSASDDVPGGIRMREAPANPLLEALRQAIAFEPIGDPVGNATVGRGHFRGAEMHAALIENRAASGSIGNAEATRLGALLRIVARE